MLAHRAVLKRSSRWRCRQRARSHDRFWERAIFFATASPSWDQSQRCSAVWLVRRTNGAFRAGAWSPLHQHAFDNAKAAIAGARLLSYLNYELPILLGTDACDDGAGAMLYQKIDGRDRSVAFMSHMFSAAERKWSNYECFGIVRAITHLYAILLGHPFTVETDHRKLVLDAEERQPEGYSLAD